MFLWHLSIIAVFGMMLVVSPALAAKRLQERSLYMSNDQAGAHSSYRISFKYMSPDPVGSIEFRFCTDPIPYNPCITPTNMDITQVNLASQLGETGFTISAKSANRIVLSRSSAVAPADPQSAYTFDNIINPTDIESAFAIHIKTFASTNATGPFIDFGGVRGQVTEAIQIETQVPPILVFCLAEEVSVDCSSTNDVYYKDMGELGPGSTLKAQSQMAIGTNASAGFAITANGPTLSAGNDEIDPPTKPVASQPGKNQFGINLTSNTSPIVGNVPEGPWTNAIATDDYDNPNLYMYKSGDLVATSPNVSLMRKFTVSYIVNSAPNLRAGFYTTTINFIASGRF